jgi:hypothetical protein
VAVCAYSAICSHYRMNDVRECHALRSMRSVPCAELRARCSPQPVRSGPCAVALHAPAPYAPPRVQRSMYTEQGTRMFTVQGAALRPVRALHRVGHTLRTVCPLGQDVPPRVPTPCPPLCAPAPLPALGPMRSGPCTPVWPPCAPLRALRPVCSGSCILAPRAPPRAHRAERSAPCPPFCAPAPAL